MRRMQSGWRRRWSRRWIKKLAAISVLATVATCGFDLVSGHAAGPGGKKQPKQKSPEKVARKTDDTAPLAAAKALPQTIADDHPLKPCVEKAETSLTAVGNLKDYSTILFKREMVSNKLISQSLSMKVRHEPFSVYLKFLDPHAGREVIYVDGQNKGKFLVHETGFKALAGTLSFLPTSKEALAENRYPVTQAGMEKMLAAVIEQWQSEGRYQEVTVKVSSGTKVGNQICEVIEVTHPKPRDYFKFHKTRLYIEVTTKLPIRLEQYSWPEKEGGEPVLMEEYTYTDVNPNLNLGDIDFDKNNPAYQF